ncbi:hypothetical protein F5144DRAFT_604252 [Chaetomium tenue]|uniref:Uncharacterized protein n=1 Tax=Chaetomium tenue TaxID=1854479 RepID=A0ACB7P491_9PEZI|nr:hypothetical protein F5144DRAFT_604252 [Chaetomium globosum]
MGPSQEATAKKASAHKYNERVSDNEWGAARRPSYQTNSPQTRNLAAEKFHPQIPAFGMPHSCPSYDPHTALWTRHEHAKDRSIGSHDPSAR